jgi:hypothetical protein
VSMKNQIRYMVIEVEVGAELLYLRRVIDNRLIFYGGYLY